MKEDIDFLFLQLFPDFNQNLARKSSRFTPKELRVCMLIRMGFSNPEIQKKLQISKSTLSNLRSSIRKKLGLKRDQNLTTSILCI